MMPFIDNKVVWTAAAAGWPSMLSINTPPFHSIHPDQARRCIIPALKHFVALFWFGQDRTIGDRDDDHGGFVCCLFFLR